MTSYGTSLLQAADRRAGRPSLAKNSGASVTAKSLDKQGSHPFGWRDTMDIIVRWRQLAEPNDQVSHWGVEFSNLGHDFTGCSASWRSLTAMLLRGLPGLQPEPVCWEWNEEGTVADALHSLAWHAVPWH